MQTETKKPVGPKIDPRAAEELAQFGDTLNAGVTIVLELWPQLYRRTMHEIRGVFSTCELRLIRDALSGSMFEPRLAGQMLPIEVHDAIILNRYDEKWGVDRAELERKIAALTACQRVCLELWCAWLWRHYQDNELCEREIAEFAT